VGKQLSVPAPPRPAGPRNGPLLGCYLLGYYLGYQSAAYVASPRSSSFVPKRMYRRRSDSTSGISTRSPMMRR
jgi:hypothetical protein